MRKRFFRAATVSIVAGLVIAFLFAIPLMGQLYTDETQKRLETVLTLAEGYELTDEGYEMLAQRVGDRLASEETAVRFTIIDADGVVLGDSTAAAAEMENHRERPEVEQALRTGSGSDIRRSETTGSREMYFARRVELPGGGQGVYRASLPLNQLGRMQATLWSCAAIGIFMGLIVALFSAHYAAGRVVEPLQRLTRAARSISAGETAAPVEDVPDEMGELAGAFNYMSERLSAAYRKLENNNEQLAAVLQGMNDGVVAVDAQGNITLMTERARELLGSYAGTVRRLSECGTHYLAVQAMLEKVMQGGEAFTQPLSITVPAERELEVYVSRLSGNASGALAVISDVTRIRKLERMRSEFVANVTHELKTPLTSIRGYIELLMAEERDAQTTRSFYEIIEIEAERLQKLTDDLLQLSDIENGSTEREVTPIPLAETVEKVIKTLRPEAQARGISLHAFVEPGLQVVAAPHRLYQLIKNLMENAVKYNRDGGAVNLSAATERGVAVIRVHDTGIGIPREHLDRIFERFYRVDKGRSRELGGTGLGLSIVKHIVNLYGGDVRVDSEPGVGTTFTVRLNCR